MNIQNRHQKIQQHIVELAKQYHRDPATIDMICVTKNEPLSNLLEAYKAGCRDFGESRVQEALEKIEQTQGKIKANWHFIGTLQKNKVNKIIGKFKLIHSVDTPELAEKISICSKGQGISTHILLQVNTSGESTKHGLGPEEWLKNLKSVVNLPCICVDGLMTMAPLTHDEEKIRKCFSDLRELRDSWSMIVKDICGDNTVHQFHHLSMGMTHDYPIAIQEGATLLRIGSALFSS